MIYIPGCMALYRQIASEMEIVEELSGCSPTILAGHPATIANGGITISGGTTALSITYTKSFSTHRLDNTAFFPIKHPVPIIAASITQSSLM
mmetsp:Transcript_16442/g.23919  ORF Transcript_16442/g.23919 Transcript_16442/m.23919 type:complete len:92 (+) Transcript_16442:486-761(+)